MIGRLLDLLGHRISFSQKKLYPFELRILEEVASKLPSKPAAKLKSQCRQVNLVQRIADGREVNLYHLSLRRSGFLPELLFTNTASDFRFATIDLKRASGKGQTLKLDLWAVHGHFFQLIYSKPPKSFFSPDELSLVNPILERCEILTDPEGVPTTQFRTRALAQDAATLLSALLNGAQVSDLKNPLMPEDRSSLLEHLSSKMPQDYVKLLDLTDGCTAGHWKIFGAAEIRHIVTSNGNFNVIAERVSYGALCTQEGRKDEALMFMDYIDDTSESVGVRLSEAMNAIDKNSSDSA